MLRLQDAANLAKSCVGPSKDIAFPSDQTVGDIIREYKNPDILESEIDLVSGLIEMSSVRKSGSERSIKTIYILA